MLQLNSKTAKFGLLSLSLLALSFTAINVLDAQQIYLVNQENYQNKCLMWEKDFVKSEVSK